jgi:hypothetical protein
MCYEPGAKYNILSYISVEQLSFCHTGCSFRLMAWYVLMQLGDLVDNDKLEKQAKAFKI